MERLGTSASSAREASHRGDAEALASALERIVFLECRVEGLAAAAAAERESAARSREAVVAAAERESDLGRRLADLEAALSAARAEALELTRRLGTAEAGRCAAEAAREAQGEGLARELAAARLELERERRRAGAAARGLADAHARLAALEAAREHLFARLVAWQRSCDGGSRESFDLAEFIAELRGEIVALERDRDEGRRREDALRRALDRAGIDPEPTPAAAFTTGARIEHGGASTGGASGKHGEREAAGFTTGALVEHPGSSTGGAPREHGEREAARAPGARSEHGEASTRRAPGAHLERASETAGADGAAPGAVGLAERFAAEGRLGIGPADVEAALEFLRPPERRLALRLAAEVTAGPASLRLRAARRLVELAGKGAAPALVAAARAERDAVLRAGLVEQLGFTGAAQALPLVERFLDDPAPEVRAAAVESAVRLDDGSASPVALRRGLADEEARVRRRSALVAASARGRDPGPFLAALVLDPDRHARRLACAALGGTRDPGAALALLTALLDPEPAVRDTAEEAAIRLFGDAARGIVAQPPLGRERAVTRLRAHVTANLARLAPEGRLIVPERAGAAADAPALAMDGDAAGAEAVVAEADVDETGAAGEVVTRQVGVDETGAAGAPVAATDRAEPVEPVAPGVHEVAAPATPSPETRPFGAATADHEPGPRVVLAPELADAAMREGLKAPEDVVDAVLEASFAALEEERRDEPGAPSLEAIVEVLRASLRGATPEALARELGLAEEALLGAIERHVEAGALVRRGKKLFLP